MFYLWVREGGTSGKEGCMAGRGRKGAAVRFIDRDLVVLGLVMNIMGAKGGDLAPYPDGTLQV